MGKISRNSSFIITAQRLKDGMVVYFTQQDNGLAWSDTVDDATVLTHEQKDEMMQRAQTGIENNTVVDLYCMETTSTGKPVGTRETIRASKAPTIPYGNKA